MHTIDEGPVREDNLLAVATRHSGHRLDVTAHWRVALHHLAKSGHLLTPYTSTV